MDQSGVSNTDADGTETTPGDEEQPGTRPSAKRVSVVSPLLHARAHVGVPPQTALSPAQTPSSAGTEPTHGDVPQESGDECPVCTEPFQTQGDHAAAVLHCNHPVCQRCLQSVQRLSRDPSRLRCPLCRQTTPLPQWDVLSRQDDMYSGGVDMCAGGRADAGADLSSWSRYRLMRIHSVYLYVSVLVLLLVMLGYLLSRGKA